MTSTRTPLILSVVALGTCFAACRAVESDVAEFRPDVIADLLRGPVLAGLDEPLDHPWEYDEEEIEEETVETRPRIAGDELIALELRGTPIAEALHLIAERAGVNMVLDAGLSGQIDASFPSVRLDDALAILLERNGLALVEEPAGVFWVRVDDGSQPSIGRFDLRSISAADVLPKLVTLVGSDAIVVGDDNQNMILVSGPEAAVQLAADFIAGADRLKPQVLLEVRIFEASLSEEFELGLSYRFDGSIDGNAWTVLSGMATEGDNFTTTFTTESGDITGTLNALRKFVGLELISSPRVMAITNTEAVVEVIEEVPYVESTSSTETDGGASTSSFEQISYKEAGIKLTMTPTIQDAGILQVDIDQELSEVVDYFKEIPVVDKRHFKSSFLVADRQTIVLGGLMQDRRADTDDGIPILMHLPFLGRLFRSDLDATERRELLVFVTPRVLDPNQAARMAKNFQREYREKRGEIASQLRQADVEPLPAEEEEE